MNTKEREWDTEKDGGKGGHASFAASFAASLSRQRRPIKRLRNEDPDALAEQL